MSRKLGAVALAMAILVGAMGLKSVLTTGAGTVLTANGPAPMPTKNPFPKKAVAQQPSVPSVR
jgi:hypothetical protein